MNYQNRTFDKRYLINVLQIAKTKSELICNDQERNVDGSFLNLVNVKPVSSFDRVHDSKTGSNSTVENNSSEVW